MKNFCPDGSGLYQFFWVRGWGIKGGRLAFAYLYNLDFMRVKGKFVVFLVVLFFYHFFVPLQSM